MSRISTHHEDYIEGLLALAELHEATDTLLPLTVEADLMREGVFLSLPNDEYED
jgi:hypothetical protein